MKKKIALFLCLILSTATYTFGQSLNDIIRYNSESPQGDARFMAMGGAFGALGGNLSGMSQNPAGSSVYLYTEFGVTAQLTNQNIQTSYFSNTQDSSTDRFQIPQFGGVFVMENTASDWSKVAFGFNIQRIQDFNQTFRAIGTNPNNGLDQYFLSYAPGNDLSELERQNGETNGDTYAYLGERYGFGTQQAFLAYQGYMINPVSYTDDNQSYVSNAQYNSLNHDYLVKRSGFHRKYTFNFSAAYKNRFHLGLNINSHQVDFEEQNDLEERGYTSDSGVQFAKFTNDLSSLGRGVSFELGAIALYNDMRIGWSYQSPTWFTFIDEGQQRLEVDYVDDNTLYTEIVDPGVINGYPEYDLWLPSRMTLSLAYTFKGRGLISADFGTQNPQNSRYDDEKYAFLGRLNDRIKNDFVRGNFLRLGSEFRLNEQLSLRAGYRSSSAIQRNVRQQNQSYSLGFGYDMGESALNIALVKRERHTQQALYQSGLTDTVQLQTAPLQVIASYVFRL